MAAYCETLVADKPDVIRDAMKAASSAAIQRRAFPAAGDGEEVMNPAVRDGPGARAGSPTMGIAPGADYMGINNLEPDAADITR